MPLQGRLAELLRSCPGQGQPELFGRRHVGRLVNLQLEGQIRAWDVGDVQEEQEERNEFWIAVRERDPVRSPVRFVLRPFTPVGDSAGDEDLTSVTPPMSAAAAALAVARRAARTRRSPVQYRRIRSEVRLAHSSGATFGGLGRSRTHKETELFETPSRATISS